MKKFLAILLVATLFVSVLTVFVSAEATSQNVAINKSYTLVGIYPNLANASWPDTDNKEITDGVFSSTGAYSDAEWVGFNIGADDIKDMETPQSAIIIDLGEEFDVTKLVVEACSDTGVGISFPSSVEYFVSTNGTDWTSVGTGTAGTAYNNDGCELVTLDGVTATGRYFKAEFTHASNWVFISEFELYALAEESEINPPTGDTFVIFSIIALISCAGAFVAVKAKR
ncbi:MAG TPA: discoidin domain-containing protein [Bacillota bacterium]|nr:discoidin domain-containing protein [Bacillota bacterium]